MARLDTSSQPQKPASQKPTAPVIAASKPAPKPTPLITDYASL